MSEKPRFSSPEELPPWFKEPKDRTEEAQLEEITENTEDEIADPSRRKFLGGLLKATALMAAGGMIERTVGGLAEKKRRDNELKEAEVLQKYLIRLREMRAVYLKEYGEVMSRSLEDDILTDRQFRRTELFKQIPDIAKLAAHQSTDDLARRIGGELAFFGVQGVYFAETAKEGGIWSENPEDYYAAKTSDFIPKGDQIRDADIDPRQYAMERPQGDVRSSVETTIKNTPGWSDPARQAEFRRVADNEEVRKMAARQGLNIAEYFSLIKAIIKFKESPYATDFFPALDLGEKDVIFAELKKTSAEVAELLINAWLLISKQRLLGPKTDSFITFTGYDKPSGKRKYFDPATWKNVGEAAGVDEENSDHFEAVPDADNAQMVREFFKAIGNSRGKTFIAVNTHGSENLLSVDATSDYNPKNPNNHNIKIDELAEALLDRVEETENPAELHNVTLCFDSCHSYIFTKNLMDAINLKWKRLYPELYKKNPAISEVLLKPTVITSSQEGSLGFTVTSVNNLLSWQTEGIKKDGGLYGRRLLKNVQPLAYSYNDLTVFMPLSSGDIIEVAENEGVKNDSEAA